MEVIGAWDNRKARLKSMEYATQVRNN